MKKISKDDLLQNFLGLFLKLLVFIVGGLGIVILSWPHLLSNPLKNLPTALTVVSRFPQKIPLPFEGKFISSLTIPYYYLPKLMSITIPVFIIVSFFVALFLVFRNKDINRRLVILILFTCVFPVVYAMIKNVALYSAWRHFLFIYPGIAIITGIGLNEIMKKINRPVLQKGFILLCFVAMAHPIAWCINNHPYEYTYFNEIEGGYKNAYNNYETDYWQVTVKDGIDWLFKNEPIMDSKDTIPIICNFSLVANYYIKRQYPKAKIKVVDGGFKSRSFTGWRYAMFNTLFLTETVIDADFPPIGTIHTVDIDNIPTTAIIKDTSRYDAWGMIHLFRFEFPQADSFFEAYLQKGDRNNRGMYGFMGISKAMKGDFKQAIEYGRRGMEYDQVNYANYFAIGLAGLLNKHYNEAYPFLLRAYEITKFNSMKVFNCSQHDFVAKLLQSIDPGLVPRLEEDIKKAKAN